MLKYRFSSKSMGSIRRLNQVVLRMNRSGIKCVQSPYCIEQRKSISFASRMMSSTPLENPLSSTDAPKYSPYDNIFFCDQPLNSSLVGSNRDLNFVYAQLDESRPLEYRVEFLINLANQVEDSRMECIFPRVLLDRVSPLLASLDLDSLLPVSWALQGLGFSFDDNAYNSLRSRTEKQLFSEIRNEIKKESNVNAPTEELARKCRNFLSILRNLNLNLYQFSGAKTEIIVDAALHQATRADVVELFRVIGFVGIKISDLSPKAKNSMVSFISQEANTIRLSTSSILSPTATNTTTNLDANNSVQGNNSEKLSGAELNKIIFGLLKLGADLTRSEFNMNDCLTILSGALQNSLDFRVPPSVDLAYEYYNKHHRENFPNEPIIFLPESFLDKNLAQIPKDVARAVDSMGKLNISSSELSPEFTDLLLNSISRTFPYMNARSSFYCISGLLDLRFCQLPLELQSKLVSSSGKIIFGFKKLDLVNIYLPRLSALAKDELPDSISEDFGRKVCAHLEQKILNQQESSLKKRDFITYVIAMSKFKVQWGSLSSSMQEILKSSFPISLPAMTTKDIYGLKSALRRMNCTEEHVFNGSVVSSPIFEKMITSTVDKYAASIASKTACVGPTFANKINENCKNTDLGEVSLVKSAKKKENLSMDSNISFFSPISLLESLVALNASWKNMSPATQHALVKSVLIFSQPSNSLDSTQQSLSSYTTPTDIKITLNRQMEMLRRIKYQCDLWDKMFALGLGKFDLARIVQKDTELSTKAFAWMYVSLQEIQNTVHMLQLKAQHKENGKEQQFEEKQDAKDATIAKASANSSMLQQDLFQDLSVFYKHVLYLSAKLFECMPVWNPNTNAHIRPLVDSLFTTFFAEKKIKGSNLTSVLRNLALLKWKYYWFSHNHEIKDLLMDNIFHLSVANNPVAIAAAAQATNLSQISKRLISLASMGFPLPVSQEAMATVNIVLDENAEKAKSTLWSDASLKDLPKLLIAQSPLLSACFAASPALAGFWEVIAIRCLAENQAAQDSMRNKSPRENLSLSTIHTAGLSTQPSHKKDKDKVTPRSSSIRPNYRYLPNKVSNSSNALSPDAEEIESPFDAYNESKKSVITILNSLMNMAKNTLTPHGRHFVNINRVDDQNKLIAKNHVFENTLCNLILMQSLKVSSWDLRRFVFNSIVSERLDDWYFSKGTYAEVGNAAFSAEQWIVALHLAKSCPWPRVSRQVREEVFRTFLALPSTFPPGSNVSSNFTSPFEELISPMLQVLSEMSIPWTPSEANLRHRLFQHLLKDKESLKRILRHQQEVYPVSLLSNPHASNEFRSNMVIQPLHITKFLPEVHGSHPTINNLPLSLSALQDSLIPTLPNIHRYQLASLIDGLAKLNVAWKDVDIRFMQAFYEELSRQHFFTDDVHAVARLAHNFASMIFDMPWETFKLPKNKSDNKTMVKKENKEAKEQQQEMLVTYNICRRLLQILSQFPDNALFGKDSSASSLFTCIETFFPKDAVVQLYSEVYPPGKSRPSYLHPIIQGQLPSTPNQFTSPVPSYEHKAKEMGERREISDHHMQNNLSELAGVSSLITTWLSTGLRTTAFREELAETLARRLLELKGKFDGKLLKTPQDRLVVKCNYAGVEYYYPISIAVLLRRSNAGQLNKGNGDESSKEIPIAFIDIGEMVVPKSIIKPFYSTAKDADKDLESSTKSEEMAEELDSATINVPAPVALVSTTPFVESGPASTASEMSLHSDTFSPSSLVLPTDISASAPAQLDSASTSTPHIFDAVDAPPVASNTTAAEIPVAVSADIPTPPVDRKVLPKIFTGSHQFNRDLVNSRTYKLKSALYNKHYPNVPLYFLSIQYFQIHDVATVLAMKILQDQHNKKK